MKSNAFVHVFKTPLNYYMYDVNKNAIVRIDKIVYDYLQNAEGFEPQQIAKLRENGYLSEKRPKKIEHPLTDRLKYILDNNVYLMTLQVTKQCNFRCAYCVYGDVAFDSQRKHEADFMTYDTAIKAVDFLAEHSKDQDHVIIGFFGGEPLLSYSLIKKVILYSENVFKDKTISYTITTNASLLTPEIAKFLFDHQCELLISFDGPPEVQNLGRRFAIDGKGSYDTVYYNLQQIIEKIPGALSHITINTVVDYRNKYQDIVHYFDTDPLMKKIVSKRTPVEDFYFIEKTVETDEYSIENEKQRFFAILSKFQLYPESDASKIVTQDIKVQLEKFALGLGGYSELPDTMAPSGPCIPGIKRTFVTTEGDILPCEKVSENLDMFKIGHINRGFDIAKIKQLLNVGQLTETECKDCWAILHCSICGMYCENDGKFSPEVKRSFCRGVRNRVEQDMIFYTLFHEMTQRYSATRR